VPLPGSQAAGDASSAQFAEEVLARHASEVINSTSLFVFISAIPDSAANPLDLPETPGKGVSIHTFSGKLIADLADAETSNGCTACVLRVDPGKYILRVDLPPGRPVEQTLVAVEGWQLQFYTRIVKAIDLSDPSVAAATAAAGGVLTPMPSGFKWQLDLGGSGALLIKSPGSWIADTDQIRWTAAARQALAAGRSKAAPDEEMMHALVHGKFENPMLGIYAGHLLAMQPKPNLSLLREVVDNLTSLVGDHPDVTPLLLTLKDPRAEMLLYNEPPMLRHSWALIVEASTPQRDPRPPGSYSARIGGNLWGSSAWLAWRMPHALPGTAAAVDLLRKLLSGALSGKLTDSLRQLTESEQETTLTPIEAHLARYLELAAQQLQVAKKFTAEEDKRRLFGTIYPYLRSVVDSNLTTETKKGFTDASLMKLTGLPYSTILTAAASLAAKLGVAETRSPFSYLHSLRDPASSSKSK
jgi:hypothetical protein